LQDFVNLAEHLIKTSNQLPVAANQVKEDGDANHFDADSPNLLHNVGTANARTISSSSSTTNNLKKPSVTTDRKVGSYRSRSRNGRTKRAENNKEKNKNADEELADSSLVPLDLSNYSKPSRLDIFLPEFIVDHVESYAATQNNKSAEVVDQVIHAEEKRAAEHQQIEADMQKAVEAMKNLEDSYKVLHEQIEATRKLFPDVEDPAHKTLDDILSNASTPRSSAFEGDSPSTADAS
jgi:hypothetical protein